jgi:hypothetical protein
MQNRFEIMLKRISPNLIRVGGPAQKIQQIAPRK